jgi:hypothetical protein
LFRLKAEAARFVLRSPEHTKKGDSPFFLYVGKLHYV